MTFENARKLRSDLKAVAAAVHKEERRLATGEWMALCQLINVIYYYSDKRNLLLLFFLPSNRL